MIRSLICAAAMMLAAPAFAQETVVEVGTPGELATTNALTGTSATESLSTAQIDGVLRTVAPDRFGQNFTRDKANKVFADFARLRGSLALALRQAIAAQPNISSVGAVNIATDALGVRLSQRTNAVFGEVGTIRADVAFVADVDGFASLFCPSVNTSFTVDNIRASGEYNYITGAIGSVAATYDVTNVSASCNGLLGFIANAFADPSAAARGQIEAAIRSELNSQIAFANMQSLFSLADFADGLPTFRDNGPLSIVGNQAITILQELVANANINTPGIVLNIDVLFANAARPQNTIRFLASHAPVKVLTYADRQVAANGVTVEMPPNTQSVDIYFRTDQNANWQRIGTTSTGSLTGIPTQGRPIWVVAVGRNGTFSGLKSFPAAPFYKTDFGDPWPGGRR